MHISEGILSPPVLVAGAVLAAGGMAMGLRRTRDEDIPRVAVLTAGFFVASLIHIPLGFGSVHLVLSGLTGLVLGWSAFPAILVGLLLQAVIFQFGGLSVLGVNTVVLAGPAVALGLVLGPILRRARTPPAGILTGGLAGGLAVAISAVLASSCLALSGRSFHASAIAFLGMHLPVIAVESGITAGMVGFLVRVEPRLLGIGSGDRT